MPAYVTLCKLTDQGIKDIRNMPKRIRAAKKMVEKLGGKITRILPQHRRL